MNMHNQSAAGSQVPRAVAPGGVFEAIAQSAQLAGELTDLIDRLDRSIASVLADTPPTNTAGDNKIQPPPQHACELANDIQRRNEVSRGQIQRLRDIVERVRI